MSANQDTVTGLSEVTELKLPERTKATPFNEKKFYPTGAIAFFIALVILCLVIWFGIYFIMLDRV